MTVDWQPLVELIERTSSFILTSHCRADCDALGSEMALARALESLGKQVAIVNGDEVPEHIAFMDREGRIQVAGSTMPLELMRGYEALIVLDTSAWGQLGPMAEVVRSFPGAVVVVDHHQSEDDMGAQVFKDAAAEATGRLVLELIEQLGVDLTPQIAEPLFAAIATDTGWFRFSSVGEATFLALAKLVAAGASPPAIFSRLYEQHTLPRLYLRGRILDHVKGECGGRLMWTYVSQRDFAETQAQQTDTEDAINALLTVAGAEVAVMFVELEPQKTKVSLRSRSDADVSMVAEQFGGGGHRAAAGITFAGSLDEAQTAILDALRSVLE